MSARNGSRSENDIRLEVPASTDHVRYIRLLTSSIASRCGFDIDAVEDLRIAVDELSNALVTAAAPAAPLRLTFTAGGDRLRVDGSVDTAIEAPELDDLSRQILVEVVDSYGFEPAEGSVSFHLERASGGGPG
jgi:serine/threonine-protein kinase RsbW